jgi:RNA polymerase sigma-70 factor (ECF subfamily)
LAVIRRASFDWLRKRRGGAASFDENIHDRGDESMNPESLMIRQDDTQLLRDALEQLPPEFREIIVLRELEGLSYQQIAVVIDVPVGTVMSRLSRARRQLQQRLAVCAGGED